MNYPHGSLISFATPLLFDACRPTFMLLGVPLLGSYNHNTVGEWRFSTSTLCLKNAPNLKRYLKIVRFNFDEIWQTYSRVSRIEFACFSFHVDLLFINFSSFRPDTENNANFDAVSGRRGNSDVIQ